MTTPTILLRPLTGSNDDLEFVRNLRNQYRHCFFNQTWILDWQQRDWFKRISSNRKYRFYIIDYNGFRVGTISRRHLFDIEFGGEQTPVYELGNLMLLPPYYGQGLMHTAIENLMSEPAFFVAHVLSGNTASTRVFERAGFATIIKRRANAT